MPRRTTKVRAGDIIRCAIGEGTEPGQGRLREIIILVKSVYDGKVRGTTLHKDKYSFYNINEGRVVEIPYDRVCSIVCRPMVRVVK